MKKLPFFLLLVFAFAKVQAQSFEGTMKWSMKMDITDPATKAKMEDAQRKMKDPANQAKMKEMQQKMNDPQMKAMMDANPQMKAQMEAAMKMMGGGDMSAMMPTGMTVKIKNSNSLTTLEGGMMDKMDMLFLKDKGQTYRLDHANKTYSIVGGGAERNRPMPEYKVTKTNETQKILDYTCTKYVVDSKTPDGKPTQQIFWTTTALDIDLKSLAQQRVGRGAPMFYENMEGVPLKIEMKMPEGMMTMEVASIKKETLNMKDFQLPPDYKETKGMGF